jgi:hypothetical protein
MAGTTEFSVELRDLDNEKIARIWSRIENGCARSATRTR